MPKLRALFRNLLHRDRVKRELDDEVGTAFDLLVKEKERSGLDPQAARRAAAARIRQGRSRGRRDSRREGRRRARRVGAGLPPGVPFAAAQSGVHGVRGGLARAGHRRGRGDLPAVRRGRAAEDGGARARPDGARLVRRAERPLQPLAAVSPLRGDPPQQHHPRRHLRHQPVRPGQRHLPRRARHRRRAST